MDSSDDIPKELLSRSISDNEIVLPYPDVVATIHSLPEFGLRVLGWEGWLRYPDGRVGHSARHQGTVSLSDMPAADAAEFVFAPLSRHTRTRRVSQSQESFTFV
jgi:hypothetical protein